MTATTAPNFAGLTLAQGGSDAIANLQPLCARCNCAKGRETTNCVAHRERHGFEVPRP